MGKHVKSLISILIAVVMICSVSAVVSAQELVDSGEMKYDNSILYTWEYYDNDVLKIYPRRDQAYIYKDELSSYVQDHFTSDTTVVYDFTYTDINYIIYNQIYLSGYDTPAKNIIISGIDNKIVNIFYFRNFSNLESVYFESEISLKKVEIENCGITSVDIFENASIEYLNVDECHELATVNVPDYVSKFEIRDCYSVSSLNIHENLESITAYNLSNLYMDSFNIPSALKQLDFMQINIKSIYVPNTCGIFAVDSSTLETATIEPGRTALNNSMFSGCENLTSVNIPDSVTRIEDLAFASCTSLTDISIPNSVNHIGLAAFSGSGIESVRIPNSVSTIHYGSFSGCRNLTTMVIPDTVTKIDDQAFSYNDYNSLEDVYFEGSRAQWENISITHVRNMDDPYDSVGPSSKTIYEVFEGVNVHFVGEMIETQSEDYTGPVGSTAEFTVVANGDGLKYQWQVLKNGVWTNCSINDGAKTATLTLEAKESRNGCIYHCVVTDKNGNSQTSNEVTLTVVTPLAITTQPEDYSGPVGDYAVFNVSAEGEGLKYQWQVLKNGTWTNCSKNDGAKTATFTQEIKDSRNGNVYQCVITDKNGDTVTTDEVTLTVKSSLSIVEQPTNFSGSVGNTAKFIVEAQGDGLKYQWQMLKKGTWTNCSINDGARTNTLSLEIKESRNGCIYHCIVTDKTGATVTSDEVTLTVCNELYIAAEPESQFAVSGQNASFTVEAEGDGVKYQWQYKKNGEWVNCSLNDGARTNTLTQAASASRDGREYHCVITDKYGNVATTRSVYLYIVSEDSLVPVSNSSTADSTVIEIEEAVEASEETVDVVEPEVVEVIDTVEESVETESVA